MQNLSIRAEEILSKFCVEIQDRSVGSDGNRKATQLFSEIAKAQGYDIEMPKFDCMDWADKGSYLKVGGIDYPVLSSPYTSNGDFEAELAVVRNIDELRTKDLNEKITLLLDDIAKEQIMPKNFVFYNPEEHQEIVKLLEDSRTLGLITATSINLEVAGGLYPFPMFEDGDFDIPSVYMKDVEGTELAKQEGKLAKLKIDTQRIPSYGYNVLARKNNNKPERIVIVAHIDSKKGTAGAIDNASGVTMLLLLAELLAEAQLNYNLEILAVNGEDYYACPGQMDYLAKNADSFDSIAFAINIDGLGLKGEKPAYSFYGLPSELTDKIRTSFGKSDQLIEGEEWVQGDHSIFIANNRPAIAFTSNSILTWIHIAHTTKDVFEIIDCEVLAKTAESIAKMLIELK